MSFFPRRLLGAALLAGALAACSKSSPPAPVFPPATAQQEVGVSGTHLTLNGAPWLPKGVVIRGFVATPAFLQQRLPLTYRARQNFGVDELSAARSFGADVLRFQISQPALDPQSALYDAQYGQDVLAAIRLARQQGFVVDLSLQDETQSGDPNPQPLLTAASVRDWDRLNAQFGTDRGVLFELYNEPRISATAAGWQRWAQGDAGAATPHQPWACKRW